MTRALHLILLTGCAATLLLAACSESSPTQTPKPIDTTGNNHTHVDTAARMLTLPLETVAGTTPFAMNTDLTADNGATFRVTKFRYYISEVALLDSHGIKVPVTLVDAAGAPVPYNLVLVDYTKPESQTLRLKARSGRYNGISLTIGVPQEENHSDASIKEYPLNVDSDMYWSWDPGRIFLKIEGRSRINGDWRAFQYHIGDDSRRAPLTAQNSTIMIDTTNTATARLAVNINRLFVTANGEHNPDLNASDQLHVNGGPRATAMAQNISTSGFITIKQ